MLVLFDGNGIALFIIDLAIIAGDMVHKVSINGLVRGC
jgi:hypothetical protein